MLNKSFLGALAPALLCVVPGRSNEVGRRHLLPYPRLPGLESPQFLYSARINLPELLKFRRVLVFCLAFVLVWGIILITRIPLP
jgi:hypothetical protein